MASPNPYATLQLRPPYRKATLDQIKQQRKKLELKYHPDKQSSEASEEFLAQCAERLAAVRAAVALGMLPHPVVVIPPANASGDPSAAPALPFQPLAATSPPAEPAHGAAVVGAVAAYVRLSGGGKIFGRFRYFRTFLAFLDVFRGSPVFSCFLGVLFCLVVRL